MACSDHTTSKPNKTKQEQTLGYWKFSFSFIELVFLPYEKMGSKS